MRKQVRYAIEAGVDIIAPECAIPLSTPLENLKAIVRCGSRGLLVHFQTLLQLAEVGVMLIIGERINSSRKNIASAIPTGDKAFLQREANVQDESGADYINVNAAAFLGEEIEKLKWVIDVVQAITELPLCIDSPDASGRAAHGTGPMINSLRSRIA